MRHRRPRWHETKNSSRSVRRNDVDHMDKSTSRTREMRQYKPRELLSRFQCNTMPFIGRDWRADGEQWTKTDLGSWQRSRSASISNSNASLADLFHSLDMINSVENRRRFNYILKIVQILFKEKLGELSGNAQRCLFQVLERMVDNVEATGENLTLMQRLLTQFENSIHRAYPFYYYIGSAALWEGHVELLQQMRDKLRQVRLEEKKGNSSEFDHLPIEMQYEILRRLDNGTDLIHVGMINSKFYRMTQEFLLWRQLCLFHFESKENQTDLDQIDWKKIFFKFKRRYGLKEIYAEMIHQCQSCKQLFWQDSRHSCPYPTVSTTKPITPRKFVNLLV